jgi:hypothetical protein
MVRGIKMILYKTIIYKITNISGLPPDNTANKTDFELNYKNTAISLVEFINFSQDSVKVKSLSYNDFKLKIDGITFSWSSVSYIENNIFYELFLSVEEQIHEDYDSVDLTANSNWQEYSLSGSFNEWGIANNNNGILEIKLNSMSNKTIILEKQGNIQHNRLKISSIFFRSLSPSGSNFTLFATRKI